MRSQKVKLAAYLINMESLNSLPFFHNFRDQMTGRIWKYKRIYKHLKCKDLRQSQMCKLEEHQYNQNY